mmetsp:Transcript_96088/g.256779  ORF Transcript_96088/g.256779 Transcript_96088/m.256779 type:complete len:201 (+) Transcript_96088:27-629(+)
MSLLAPLVPDLILTIDAGGNWSYKQDKAAGAIARAARGARPPPPKLRTSPPPPPISAGSPVPGLAPGPRATELARKLAEKQEQLEREIAEIREVTAGALLDVTTRLEHLSDPPPRVALKASSRGLPKVPAHVVPARRLASRAASTCCSPGGSPVRREEISRQMREGRLPNFPTPLLSRPASTPWLRAPCSPTASLARSSP